VTELQSRGSQLTLIASLAVLCVPFLLTGHIQEDAFIVFRIAFNFADHGVFSFNLDESYAAATSLLYAYWVAIVRLAAGEWAIPAVLAVNATMAACATVLLGTHLRFTGSALRRFALLVALSNGALIASFNGLETAAYLLWIAMVLGCIGHARATPWFFVLLLTLSALVRPDALVVSGLAIGVRCVMGDREERRDGAWGIAGVAAAVMLMATLNHLHSGTWLPPSLTAKLAAVGPSFSPVEIARRLIDVYLFGPLSLLPSTRYLPPALVTFTSTVALAAPLLVGARVAATLDRTLRMRIAFLLMLALVLPALFATAGVMFPWYFYPSAFALAGVLGFGLLRVTAEGAWLRQVAFGFIGAAAILQLLISINIGRQESGFRASVGRYLAEVSAPADTLVLEPAGVIPFYAKLTTYDDIGLASPRVRPLLGRPEIELPVELLREACSTFTVQRAPFPEDQVWPLANYELKKWFQYRPADWARFPLEQWVLERGSHADYLVYRRRDGVSCR
jgi:hypothetical protein